eukprot:1001555-Pelagomonas_calceolata.AAC.1
MGRQTHRMMVWPQGLRDGGPDQAQWALFPLVCLTLYINHAGPCTPLKPLHAPERHNKRQFRGSMQVEHQLGGKL